MICLEPGLYVRVNEMANGPLPRPLASGFSTDTAYRVLGLFNASETSEGFLVCSNDRDEVWYVSHRHFRTMGVRADERALRLPISELSAWVPRIAGGFSNAP